MVCAWGAEFWMIQKLNRPETEQTENWMIQELDIWCDRVIKCLSKDESLYKWDIYYIVKINMGDIDVRCIICCNIDMDTYKVKQ